jgi:peptidoglycan/LPS O-acetylase OafA/YrhL
MDWRMTFGSYPQAREGASIAGLWQAWTLSTELLFYLVASSLVRSCKYPLPIFVLSFGSRMAFVVANGPGFQGLWTHVFPPSAWCFSRSVPCALRQSALESVERHRCSASHRSSARLPQWLLAQAATFDSPRKLGMYNKQIK